MINKDDKQYSGAPFLSGGKSRMSGKNTSGTQKPGQTMAGAGSSGAKFAAGGNNKTFKQGQAAPARAGTVAASGITGPGPQFASGGKTKMFGNRGSQARTPGSTGGV